MTNKRFLGMKLRVGQPIASGDLIRLSMRRR